MDNRGLANRMLRHSLDHLNGLSAPAVTALAGRMEDMAERRQDKVAAIVRAIDKPYNDEIKTELLAWAAQLGGECNALRTSKQALALLLFDAKLRDAELYRELNNVVGSEDFQRQVSSAMFEREFGAN